MKRQIQYQDPENGVTYTLVYDDTDPALVRITGPRQQAGVLIPFRALEYLMATYRLDVVYDHQEHRPVNAEDT